MIFLHVTTYALSSTVLPVVRRAKVPVIILNLQPGAAIDYTSFNKMGDRTKMTGEWLAYCAACPVPEIANAFNRARIAFPSGHGRADRMAARSWAGDRRVDRGRARRPRDGAQPARADGALLQRHARHLYRHDPADRVFRRPHRDRRGGGTGGACAAVSGADEVEGETRGVPRGLRYPSRIARRRNSSARRAPRWRSTKLVAGTTSARWPTITWAPATRKTRM